LVGFSFIYFFIGVGCPEASKELLLGDVVLLVLAKTADELLQLLVTQVQLESVKGQCELIIGNGLRVVSVDQIKAFRD